jgi:hypothetical protein
VQLVGRLHVATADVIGDQGSPDSAAVVLRVEGQDKPMTVVESGSIDDVIKKLQSQIDELKKARESSDSARDRIKVLVQALDEIKKVQDKADRVTLRIHTDHPAKVQKAEPTAKDKAEIEKLGVAVSKLRKNVEENLKELEAIQARIRKLGGDPGEAPVVRWRRIADTRLTQSHAYAIAKAVEGQKVNVQTYTIAKPFEVKRDQVKVFTNVKPFEVKRDQVKVFTNVKPVDVKSSGAARIEVVDPAEQKVRMLLKGVEEKVHAGEKLDSTRIEALEKKLKALQDEVERLKKGSADSDEKK